MADVVEHTLFVCREVTAFQIPPRPAAGGHRSGDWKVADKVFTGRLRVLGKGDVCEVQLIDANSGDLFAMCPVPPGQRPQAVEPAADSSRNFVLRLVDATTGRHAFVGLSFADRGEAFDFNVALSDHEKQLRRTAELAAQRANPDTASASGSSGLAAPQQDLSLKAGETIKVKAVKRADAPAGGFLSKLRTSGDGSLGLPPPPQATSMQQQSRPQQPFLSAPQQPFQAQQQSQSAPAHSSQATDDFLGLGAPPAAAPAKQPQQPAAQAADSWTTF